MSEVDLADRPEGFRRVTALLAEKRHPHVPVFLEVAARTAQEAADALGITRQTLYRRMEKHALPEPSSDHAD